MPTLVIVSGQSVRNDVALKSSLQVYDESHEVPLEVDYLPSDAEALRRRIEARRPTGVLIPTFDAETCRAAVGYCQKKRMRFSVVDTGNSEQLLEWLTKQKISLFTLQEPTYWRGAITAALHFKPLAVTVEPTPSAKPPSRWEGSNGNAVYSAPKD